MNNPSNIATLPPGMTLSVSPEFEATEELWDTLEFFTMSGDLGNEREKGHIDAIITNHNGDILAGTWSITEKGQHEFHVAVSYAHQGIGVGRTLIDWALADFKRRQTNTPELTLELNVMNHLLIRPLLRRGLRILKEPPKNDPFAPCVMGY